MQQLIMGLMRPILFTVPDMYSLHTSHKSHTSHKFHLPLLFLLRCSGQKIQVIVYQGVHPFAVFG